MHHSQWYAAQTLSKQECEVKDKLMLINGIEDVFIPEGKFVNDNKKVVLRKIIPRYIFIRMTLDDNLLAKITRIKGFVKLLSQVPVPDKEIAKFKHNYLSGGNMFFWKVGAKVRITQGPFSDFTGRIEAIEGDRVKISLYILGRNTTLDIAKSELEEES